MSIHQWLRISPFIDQKLNRGHIVAFEQPGLFFDCCTPEPKRRQSTIAGTEAPVKKCYLLFTLELDVIAHVLISPVTELVENRHQGLASIC